MRALKSKLASELLADPAAGDQLRDFLVNKKSNGQIARQSLTGQFVVNMKNNKGSVRISAVVVPKAAKSD